MPTQITDSEFAAASGTEDWCPLFWGAKALFETGDFATGVRFINRIGAIVTELDHAPLLDVRADSITITVLTIGVGLSDTDLELARRISGAARELDIPADPSAVQHVQLAIDAEDPEAVLGFWKAALDMARFGPDDLVDKNLDGPSMWFQHKPHVAPRNRIHVDVSLPPDQAQRRIDAILAAGGRILGDRYAPAWTSLVDAEGNVVDVCTWQGRKDAGA